MEPLVADPSLIARCGLYCGACRSYLRGKCPGCSANAKASWCKVRSCCLEHGYGSCADCASHADPRQCARFDTWIARLIGFVLRSDRAACIARIKELGREEYARRMAAERAQTVRR